MSQRMIQLNMKLEAVGCKFSLAYSLEKGETVSLTKNLHLHNRIIETIYFFSCSMNARPNSLLYLFNHSRRNNVTNKFTFLYK